MGSVKDLNVVQKPTAGAMGKGHFTFSDRYSVFDWGEMPNHIPQKGKALCMIGAHFFEKLKSLGIKTHYTGLVENGQEVQLAKLQKPVNVMAVKLVRVLKPELHGETYDYSVYQKERTNFLIPLEVIYRNALPEGSSVFKRFKDGSLKPQELGLQSIPQPGSWLAKPILDVSTKLETTDRYMPWDEAQGISALSRDEIEHLKATTLKVNALITEEARRLGLAHEDGKIEFGFDENRELVLVDVLGTPDECRFVLDGIPVSKEAARVFYRKSDWYQDVEAAKKTDKIHWKNAVKNPPPKLPPRLEELIAHLYQSCCNGLTGQAWFDVPPLKDIVAELKKTL